MLEDYELVQDYQEILENIKEFNKSVEGKAAGISRLNTFKHWFYAPELEMFGPSNLLDTKK
ncbi:MAG TPA: hypothetical protein GX697_02465 [Firmicutes bacterium]|nr:hypothetical protein [Bacillota bacterium]